MRCPGCGTINPPEEQLTYCKKCGTELRVVCPRCSADNPGHAEHCGECGLELHPDRGHERAAGIRVDTDTDIVAGVLKKRPTLSTGMIAAGFGVLLVIWIPIFSALRKKAQLTGCQSNLKKIAMAMQVYARDNGGHAPTGYEWSTQLLPYVKDRNSLMCPSRPGKVGYAFNLNLNEAPVAQINNSGTLIAFFETGSEKAASGTQNLWLARAAHSKGNNVVFVDGTVKQTRNVPPDQFWQAQIGSAPVAPAPQTAPEATAPAKTKPAANPPRPGETPPESPVQSSPEGSADPTGTSPSVNLQPGVNPPPPNANPSPAGE